MKKEWKQPELEVLSVQMTMAGPGKAFPDSFIEDEDEVAHLNHS
ncbi:paeninodin family lasso peptide [Gorillibacterium sp. CAU 1737]